MFCVCVVAYFLYAVGVPGFRRAAARELPESPEDGEGEGAAADRLPKGAGASWSGVSETQQSQG